MRLISVHMAGYKRFASATTLWVNGPLIAIVGPNEAGKTSLLRAMKRLTDGGEFARIEYSGRHIPDGSPDIVAARFAVEREDREGLDRLLEAKQGYTLTVIKRPRSSDADWKLEPELFRDDAPRRAFLATLRTALEKHFLIVVTPAEDEAGEDETDATLHDQAVQLADALDAAGEDLTATQQTQLSGFADALREEIEQGCISAPGVLDAADALGAHEREENPHVQAGHHLMGMVPRFLLFDEDNRRLQNDYEWAEFDTAPPALGNLIHLAGIDFNEYREIALDRERRDELQTLEQRANQALRKAYAVWTQAELSVEFRADNQGMQLQVRDHRALRNVPFDQRSDGLRSFVALVAFAVRYAGDRAPVLLIDEAEMHLHYGGQADLVQVFERQKLAQTILYTTHSIGCLPDDLGTTIRVVAPTGEERSEIRNSFWEGGAGMTPLMLAMGATALAFTPSRFAVVGEGPTEAILLPSMLREARDKRFAGKPLGFQVAPGISEVRPEAAADLELDAGNVAYLIDADEGGRSHANKLADRVKEEGRLIELGGGKQEGLCIEDFAAKPSYVRAINSVLQDTRDTDQTITADDLPDVGRGGAVNDWCRTRGLEPVSKTLVAQRLVQLHQLESLPLIEPARRKQLASLYTQLRRILGVPD
jgi:energy-coupling factor transporter ATP-binding protein EcfA2